MNYSVRLNNHPAEDAFDGTQGEFATWISINEKRASSMNYKTIFRGTKVPGGFSRVNSDVDQILYLKKGDKLQVRFFTYGARGMNENLSNVCLYKDNSSITLWKL